MQLAICWSGIFHLHLRRQKSNCSSHIASQFMDVLFGQNSLENLLSVIVTHSNDLLMSPDTPARVWHFATNATDHIYVVFRESAFSLMSRETVSSTELLLPLSITMRIISHHYWIGGRVCYMYKNKNRLNLSI